MNLLFLFLTVVSMVMIVRSLQHGDYISMFLWSAEIFFIYMAIKSRRIV